MRGPALRLGTLAMLGLAAWWAWDSRLPPPPPTSHDPFNLGYADSPDKPEALRRAEEIIVADWGYMRGLVRNCLLDEQFVNTHVKELKGLERVGLYFRSEYELRKYNQLETVPYLFQIALGRYDRKNGTELHAQLQKPIGTYLQEYRDEVLGIRRYDVRVPADLETLRQSGVPVVEPL
ncbi:MAG: hypothetical protein GWP08_10045 [Nitrospiraceae bacterium]|nr:hypothetical protein [Nitrospiraceae bacterium]